ncbi:MAG: lytic transglycosylase domain-containing protein [Candidatus Tectomicrobia bacterium]
MQLSVLLGLVLLEVLPSYADIVRYRGSDGRFYFTNTSAFSVGPTLPSTTVRPVAQPTTGRTQLLSLVRRLAQQYDVDARLVQAIIAVESHFNPRAVSHAGARGLMQLMPATAARYQVDNPFDPAANVVGGIRYLKDLLQRFAGNVRHALAAYNAGEQAVARYGGVPPYRETQRYLARVMALYGSDDPQQKIYRYRTVSGSILFTDTPR